VWQALRAELYPRGLEIVTVALDTGGSDAVRPWIEAAQPAHPALIDRGHIVDALFGIVNVPSGVWIDETGTIVRPPETAYPRRPDFLDRLIPADATPRRVAQIMAVKQLRIDADGYIAALRDWVARGAESRYALAPSEVAERSRPRPIEESAAAAHFELGQYLHLTGKPDAAIHHFREAHQLQPDNWTYKRQAWNLLPTGQSSAEVYGADWLTEVQKIGAENYYPTLNLGRDAAENDDGS
jgi:tetratricopeptide (TPR) repeat protein